MTWPLLERELRRALRHRRERQIRLWGTVICAALASLFLLGNAGGNKSGWGAEFSHLLLLGGMILILQIPSYTAGVFAEERRNQTLGLLFLCGIGGTQLFLSKTLGAAFVSFSRLLLLYPFLAIAFLGGGLSTDLFLAITCSLPVTLLFVFSVCVFASVCCREESTALALAGVLAFGLCLPVPLWLRISPDPINSLANHLLVISPARAPYLAATQLSTGSMAEFWKATTISLLWSGLLLAAAGFVLERIWQDQPDRVAGGGWRAQWSRWLRGDWNWRRGLARRWHEINPYIWLAQRDRWPVMLAWAALAGGFGLWLGLVAVWWKIWLSPAGLFVVAVLANSVLNAFVHFAAAKTIGEARSSGALELLLTTPLSHLDVVRGQLLALREQFRPHARFLLAGNVIMLLIGLVSRPWTGSALGIYLTIWAVLLAWTGSFWFGTYRGALVQFWDSLVCGRPAYVLLRRMNFFTSPFWWIYLIFIGNRLINGLFGRGFQTYPQGTAGEWTFLILMGLILLVVARFNQVLRNKLELRLATDFRIVAAVPVPEPSDPRYKHWKSGEPFPDMFTDYLVGRVLQQVRREQERTNPSRQADHN